MYRCRLTEWLKTPQFSTPVVGQSPKYDWRHSWIVLNSASSTSSNGGLEIRWDLEKLVPGTGGSYEEICGKHEELYRNKWEICGTYVLCKYMWDYVENMRKYVKFYVEVCSHLASRGALPTDQREWRGRNIWSPIENIPLKRKTKTTKKLLQEIQKTSSKTPAGNFYIFPTQIMTTKFEKWGCEWVHIHSSDYFRWK